MSKDPLSGVYYNAPSRMVVEALTREIEDAYDRGRKDGGSLVADTTADAVEKFKARIAELETQLKQMQKAIVNQFDEGRNCAREAAAKRIAELETQLETSNQRAVEREKVIADLKDTGRPYNHILPPIRVVRNHAHGGFGFGWGEVLPVSSVRFYKDGGYEVTVR
jgi:Mg2+ and Co2+ transporter CorA